MKYTLIILAFFILSCEDDLNRSMTNNEIKFVDSLVINHQKVWRSYYDSICVINQDSMIRHYFDSLLLLDMESIKKLER